MSVILTNNDSLEQENFDDLARIRAKEISEEFKRHCLPTGFRLDEEGVWYQAPSKKSQESAIDIWICSRLSVTAYVRDQHNDNWGRLLEFYDLDGNLHEWVMPMSMMARDGAEYRDELLRKGLLISYGSKVKALLNEYIQCSQPTLRARCVLQTGWCGKCFVLPDETLGMTNNERIFFQSTSCDRYGYKQEGSFKKWQELAYLCTGNNLLILAISIAFASPLLRLLGEENGGFHFRGPSSIGKTTLLRVAASIWGSSDFLQRWRSTSNGLEAISAAYNDSLLCLDEIEQMHASEIGEVAYMLANGSGKIRSEKYGNARKKSSWQLYFLSTGEISLSTHIQQGGKHVRAGQEVRILDIPADKGKYGIFEELHGFETASELSDYLSLLAKENYGLAIRKFLKDLIFNFEDNLKEIKDIAKKIQMRIEPKNVSGQISRVCKRFSIIAAAGELATRMGITGWQIGQAEMAAINCFNHWLETRGCTGPQESQLALNQVRAFFEKNGDSAFSPWEDEGFAKTTNRAGSRKYTEEGVEFYVFTQSFKNEICKGLDYSFVAKACIQKGWLIPEISGNATRAERMWKNSKPSRCYHFSPKVLTSEV